MLKFFLLLILLNFLTASASTLQRTNINVSNLYCHEKYFVLTNFETESRVHTKLIHSFFSSDQECDTNIADEIRRISMKNGGYLEGEIKTEETSDSICSSNCTKSGNEKVSLTLFLPDNFNMISGQLILKSEMNGQIFCQRSGRSCPF